MKQPSFERAKARTNPSKPFKQKIKKKIEKLLIVRGDNPNVHNMIKRELYDPEYHSVQIKFQNRFVCFYCGVPATGYDHYPPLSRCDTYLEHCKQNDIKPQLLKLSCCEECNRLLGNTMTWTLEERLTIIRDRIKKKHAHVTPDDKLNHGRLLRRLHFTRGIDRLRGRYT